MSQEAIDGVSIAAFMFIGIPLGWVLIRIIWLKFGAPLND